MTPDATSQSLLLGALALRMKFLTPDTFATGVQSWSADPSRSLTQVLEDLGLISRERRQLLEALVDQHTSKQSESSASDETAPETRAPALAPAIAGSTRYRIVRPHARGGLGQVSIAMDGELHREVALKEIQPQHADRPDSRARFLLEAEITGGLEHPGIVPVYGLGQYVDGRPYYAMRFIRGESLADAVAALHRGPDFQSGREKPDWKSGPRERRNLVRRLQDVCNTIAYAHSRGVLHRDLKPGNIMLGAYGETLVVDWGLARPFTPASGLSLSRRPDDSPPLNPASLSAMVPTRTGEAVGTPGFMSPEQIAGQLHQLGPASDVYSLGATLYCLLTSQPPVVEKEYDRLRERVLAGDIAPPRRLDPSIPQPLEAVCLKALATLPEDRYPTAREMGEDLERWLNGEPILAAPEPLPQRVGRWVRRHRSLTAAAAALLIGITLALAGATVAIAQARDRAEEARQEAETGHGIASAAQLRETEARKKAETARQQAEQAQKDAEKDRERAEQARRLAEDNRQAAEAEKKKAREEEARSRRAASFFLELFEGVNPDPFGLGDLLRPGAEQANRITARQVIDAGAKKVAQLADQPLIQAAVLDALGNIYRGFARYKEAQPLLQQALRLRQQHLPAEHSDITSSLFHLARLEHEQGKYNEAVQLYNQVFSRGHEQPAEVAARCELLLSLCLIEKRDFVQAEQRLKRLLDARIATLGEKHRDVAVVQLLLATLYLEKGDAVSAMGPATKALPALVGGEAGSDALKVIALFQQAMAAKNPPVAFLRSLPTSEKLLRQVLEPAQRFLPDSHPLLALVLFELADTLDQQGKFVEAEREYRACLAALRRGVGLEHPRAVIAVRGMADFLARQGKLAESKTLFTDMRTALLGRFGPDHEVHLLGLEQFADLAERFEDWPWALELNREYARLLKQLRKPGTFYPDGMYYEARSLLGAGRAAEAEAKLREALSVGRTMGLSPVGVAIYGAKLAETLAAQGKHREAEPLLADALKVLRANQAAPVTQRAGAMLLEARLARDRGDRATAARAADEAVTLLRSKQLQPAMVAAHVLAERAGLYLEQEQPAKALALLREALPITRDRVGAMALPSARLLARIAVVQLEAGSVEDARQTCEELLRDHGKTTDPAIALLVARTCSLGQDKPAALLADLVPSPNHPAGCLALAQVKLRAGDAAGALRLLEGKPGREAQPAAYVDLLRVLALHRLGRIPEARELLKQTEQRLDALGKPEGNPPPTWDEWSELRLLRREATQLMKKL
jgi:serine/threonine protein kinase/tetratricopeptide (TPR) repeat protein